MKFRGYTILFLFAFVSACGGGSSSSDNKVINEENGVVGNNAGSEPEKETETQTEVEPEPEPEPQRNDADNNGISDGFQSDASQADVNANGIIDGFDSEFTGGIDRNRNGVDDVFEFSMSVATDNDKDGINENFVDALVNSEADNVLVLTSDGADTANAKQLIYDSIMGRSVDPSEYAKLTFVEDQSCEGAHLDYGEHLDEVYDSDLDKTVFRAVVHVNDDVDCSTSGGDRQRFEITTNGYAPKNVTGEQGEWHTYRWLFKVDSDFQSSGSFGHIFQIKAISGDSGWPIATLTPRNDSLELAYTPSGSATRVLTQANLEQFKGQWIESLVRVNYVDNNGYLEVYLRDYISKETLLYSQNMDIDMWRDGSNTARPKWGLYRYILPPALQSLKDETIWLHSMCIAEKSGRCPSF